MSGGRLFSMFRKPFGVLPERERSEVEVPRYVCVPNPTYEGVVDKKSPGVHVEIMGEVWKSHSETSRSPIPGGLRKLKVYMYHVWPDGEEKVFMPCYIDTKEVTVETLLNVATGVLIFHIDGLKAQGKYLTDADKVDIERSRFAMRMTKNSRPHVLEKMSLVL